MADFVEFPFQGAFYRSFIDESLPLEEQVEEKTLLFETKCDIQQTTTNDSGGFVDPSFAIYFPIDISQDLLVKRGDFFEGSMYGMQVNGEVIGIYASQLGGCTVYLKDRDV